MFGPNICEFPAHVAIATQYTILHSPKGAGHLVVMQERDTDM